MRAFGPHLPPSARINRKGRMTYCTVPAHQDGEHGPECLPPADPHNPELRLLRAIFGLCGLCDRTENHHHRIRRGRMAHIPGLTPNKEKRDQERQRGQMAKTRLSGQIAKMQKDRKAQEAAGKGSG